MITLSSLKDRPITSQSRGNRCLVLLFVYSLWSILVLLYSTLLPFLLFCNHLANEEEAGCFTCIVFLISRGCCCSLPLPRGAVGGLQWSIVAFHGYTYFLLGFSHTSMARNHPSLYLAKLGNIH